MNAPAHSVAELLKQAESQIRRQKSLSYSAPALEARLLFEHASGKNHSWQIAHGEETVTTDLRKDFCSLLSQRLSGVPIAFIIGTQDFWSLTLAVSDCTLIPRQDTESLVEAALSLALPETAKVIDLGTGTGAIALALAKERPKWQVIGVDFVPAAVELAKQNAQRNQLSVAFLQSNWLEAVKHLQFDLIVSNPPYVESGSEYLQQGDLRFEPDSALSSGEDGLDDIRCIIEQAYDCLLPNGYLVIEHGYTQSEAINDLLSAKGFLQITTKTDYNGQPRVTLAQMNKRA
ncbi:peptide chain release factor N(5)-glutamine methyltransferase [Glaciecola sp. SC05]|uniref:peptide chain release factor N(5)-glutamine methyltransferase n=1 Tax=Glaciecola sp. SC05 TaxID=1987355 RepID=UPI0035292A4A